MRFLIAFVAIIGYASASYIGALGYGNWGVSPGDVQGAVIDSTVVARDHARAAYEGQARVAEAAIQYNNEATRQAIDANRNINENVLWGSVAAAQSQAAAVGGAIASRAGYGAPYLAAPYGAGALGAGVWGGLGAPYGLGLGAW